MSPHAYLTLPAGADVVHELEIKRSRFLCVLRRAASEADARACVAELRASHPQARHHCSAFVVGPRRELQRSSDDGEPSGTAGMPMLQALLGHGSAAPADEIGPLSDVVAVVVRYFGGVLLGAGGLVRAYSGAVVATLEQAKLVRRERRRLYRLSLPHETAGRLEHELRAADLVLRDVTYGADGVAYVVAVPDTSARAAGFADWCAERRLSPVDVGVEWIDLQATADDDSH